MSDATSAYRGYRLQALYILHRILSETRENITFYPEGIEDLDIRDSDNVILEAIQVKSYASLKLSNLGSEKKRKPFFQRAATVLKKHRTSGSIVVNFGKIGPELKVAWQHKTDKENPERKSVSDKLQNIHGLEQTDVELVFKRVGFVSVDENELYDEALDFIRKSAAGISPQDAFDLFMQWIYYLSERRQRVTKADIIAKFNHIGRALTQRANFIGEWHTSIQPIEQRKELGTAKLATLRAQFYEGVSARYEHIQAELDFRREDKLDAIVKEFQNQNIVIIHGASGQGKTTLAYRYLHDYYPATWRYQVVLIESPSHALRIASALNGQADALEAPIVVYIDVRPNDINWTELVQQLAQHKWIRVLVTVREEDFRQATLPRHQFDYETVGLTFDVEEAKQIYHRAIESERLVQAKFLNFDASWDAFREQGPLMEYVFLLTQTETLQERLKEQLNNILSEVAGQEVSDKWDVLRWVAVASAYEARLPYQKLREMVTKPALVGHLLTQLEKEYLVRRSEDGEYIEGLHAIRSRILVQLMIENDPFLWNQTTQEILPILPDLDLQPFILNAFIDRPESDQSTLLEHLTSFYPSGWAGCAGVLRSLLWIGVRNYINANRELINQVENEVAGGWQQIVLDIDLVNFLEERFPFDSITMPKITPENRQKIERYREAQTPKDEAFIYAKAWFESFQQAPDAPKQLTDWLGLAVVWGWAGLFQLALHCHEWVTDVQLAELVADFPLQVVGDVSTAFYACAPSRHGMWTENHKKTIDARLADEYTVLELERDETGEADGETRIKIHFVPIESKNRLDVSKALLKPKLKENQLHTATIERVELVSFLYPTYERYASQGYGFGLGSSLPLPHDPTVKDMKGKYAAPHWLIRVNQLARGLGEYPFRPQSWDEYVQHIMQARREAVDNLRRLQTGLLKFAGSQKGVNIVKKHFNEPEWNKAKATLTKIPKLPQTAVDPWGFSSDTNRASATSETEAVGLLGAESETNFYIPKGIALKKYEPYLQAQGKYLNSLKLFFEQSVHILFIHSVQGKLPHTDQRREKIQEEAEKLGYRQDYDHYSTRNYWTAVSHLEKYQQAFRQLLGPMVDEDTLAILEQDEQRVIPDTWTYWYYFAIQSREIVPNARRRLLKKVEWKKTEIDREIDSVLANLSSEEQHGKWHAQRLETDLQWEEKPALWVTINVENPIEYYGGVEVLIQNLRENFGERKPRLLLDYLLERDYHRLVIIPLAQGRLIHPICYAPNFARAFYKQTTPDSPLSYAPNQLTSQQIAQLNLSQWTGGDFELANLLANAVSVIRIAVSQRSEFSALPETFDDAIEGESLEQYFDEQNQILSEYLQQFVDARDELIARFNNLTESEQEACSELRECIGALIRLSEQILPHEGETLELELSDLSEYVKNLDTVALEEEVVRLNWVAHLLKTRSYKHSTRNG